MWYCSYQRNENETMAIGLMQQVEVVKNKLNFMGLNNMNNMYECLALIKSKWQTEFAK